VNWGTPIAFVTTKTTSVKNFGHLLKVSREPSKNNDEKITFDNLHARLLEVFGYRSLLSCCFYDVSWTCPFGRDFWCSLLYTVPIDLFCNTALIVFIKIVSQTVTVNALSRDRRQNQTRNGRREKHDSH